MAIASYKLRINGVTVIDAGLVYTYEITGLTEGALTSVELAALDDEGQLSEWSDLVYKTPTCASFMVDDDGNFILDDDGNQIVVYV